MRIEGDLVTVRLPDSNRYGGIIDYGTLGQLTQEYVVDLAAFVSVPVTSDPKSRTNPDQARTTLQIVIYGLKIDGRVVGSFLSAKGLYLQHPRHYDVSKTYCNPHYLARPGREDYIPTFAPVEADLNSSSVSSVLDDVDKGRILQVFDCAQGPETVPELQLNSSLKTPLKS